MQKNDQIRKIKINIDGKELLDLVKFGEINLESISAEVPSFDRIRTILSGTIKINPIVCTFKIRRDSETVKILRDWEMLNQIKDVIIVETDGTGVEYNRILLPATEGGSIKLPEYDAANPAYSQAEITLYPDDVIFIS